MTKNYFFFKHHILIDLDETKRLKKRLSRYSSKLNMKAQSDQNTPKKGQKIALIWLAKIGY